MKGLRTIGSTVCLLLLQEEIIVADDCESSVLSQLGEHSVFGEVAVLCNVPQPNTVRVTQLCKLLRLDKESFTSLLQLYFLDSRQIIKNLLGVIPCFRFKYLSTRCPEAGRWVCYVLYVSDYIVF